MDEKHTIKKADDDYLIVEGDLSLLSVIKNKIARNNLEELAASVLKNNMTDSSLKFFISKQSAFNNKFHILDEPMSSLGEIEVEVSSSNPKEVIDWIIS